MKKIIIIVQLILVASNSGLYAQNIPCFSNHNYSESVFQLKKKSDNNYKTVLTTLGFDYLSPCINKIEPLKPSNEVRIFGRINGKVRCSKVEILLLKERKGLINIFKKYKHYRLVKKIGNFDTDVEIFFQIKDIKAFTLLFINITDNSDSIAIQFKLVKN
jgi:hypothetical protein